MTNTHGRDPSEPRKSLPSRRQRLDRLGRRRLRRLLGLSSLLALAGLVAIAYAWRYAGRFVTTDDAYVAGNIVPLKAQTHGTVVEVRTDNTRWVQQGEVLVRLDGLDAQVALERAEADLAEAVRQAAALFDGVESLAQRLAAQQAEWQRVSRDLARYLSVLAEGAVTVEQVEDAQFRLRALRARILQTRAELRAAQALVKGTQPANHPRVRQAASALKRAYLDAVRREIVAPVSGYVAKRTIQPGDQVHPDMPLLAIVPLDALWVDANFLEDQLAAVRPGQPVTLTADLYGAGVVFHGRVLGLEPGTGSVFGLLPPNNATGNYIHITERVPVRIGLDAAELHRHPLRPGLSMRVRIDTSQPGRSVLEPITRLPGDAYATSVYERQLQGAEHLIRAIIAANL
ncbi:efflux RND transporter periplasmic adaptor subunit [Candidatus Methylocalor cossyra]|uniref:Membrane fusion protein (Multidrug efflux system) n=1 Tax=Candidatus Methylocalor cossyra TaxID=3108543 RepID=A0ABM9NM07_9GAMM